MRLSTPTGEVVDHDIGLERELACDVAGVVAAEVELEHSLVAVPHDVGRDGRHRRRVQRGVELMILTTSGAHVGEDARREGSGEDMGEVGGCECLRAGRWWP